MSAPEKTMVVVTHVPPCQKTTVVISMFMHSTNQRCNALQSIIGIFLHACDTPEKVVKVLARMGISISLTSIHRAIKSLSQEACHNIRVLGQTLLAAYGFDNFELLLKTGVPTIDKPGEGLLHLISGTLLRLDPEVTLDDLRCSRLLWERSELNPRASDPRPFDPYQTIERLYELHLERDRPEGALSRRGRYRAWVFKRTLFKYGPESLRQYNTQADIPEAIEEIPVRKLEYLPLRTMDLNQSTVTGNIEAIQNMFTQAGVGDPKAPESTSRTGDAPVDLTDFVSIMHGDLGTYERVLSAMRRRSIEDTEYNRLQSVVFAIGLFHFKMAAADAIWRIHVAPDKARLDESSFIKIVGKLRPNESSRLVANAKFRQQHELIGHVSTLLQLDAWRVEVTKRTGFSSLEDWAMSKPSLEDVDAIADGLVRNYVEGEGLDLFKMECDHPRTRDIIQHNTMRLQNHLLLYDELCYAMNAGDIGRVESLIPAWIQIFRATGKHKYGNYTLRFMHSLHFVYPERLR